MELTVFTTGQKKVSEINLSDSVMQEKVNKAVLHAAVKTFLASKHHGTVRTKTRAEVNRTNKKIYRQKGTGGARHGSRKTSPFVGGGRVFGPKPRDFTLGLNKKVKSLALKEALRARILANDLLVVDKIPLNQMKTKEAEQFFKGFKLDGALIILDRVNANVERSIRNLPKFKVIYLEGLNVFDLLKYSKVVVTQEAFELIKNKYLMDS